MAKIDIKKLLEEGERITLECKKAKTSVPDDLWPTYSAFANTLGGTILLGINEDLSEKDVEKRFTVTGVEDAGKIRKDLWNMLNNQQKVSVNILSDSDVVIETIDDKDVIAIRVPRARYNMRPVYINGRLMLGNIYKRNYEGDYRCSESEMKAMMRDANEDGNDGMLIEHYTMDDVDEWTIREYRQEFRDENKDHPWNKCDDKTFLKNLGGYLIDRATGEEGLTLAGLLMFGKGLSIRERFSNFRMDYIDFTGIKGEERYHDRLTYDGRWENNLYQFFTMVSPKLTRDLPRPFKLVGNKRADDTPQHKAVREALTNAIIHSDVFLAGGILRIEKHDDRLCFRNPGTLKLPIQEIYEGGNSKARNPKMQDMLRMIGFGENLGSGFPKIIDAWKEAHWNAPTLEDKLTTEEVRLTLPVPFKEHTNVTDNAENVTDNVLDRLTERQKVIYNILKSNVPDNILDNAENVTDNVTDTAKETTETLAKRLSVSVRTIKRDMKVLQELGFIKRDGANFGGRWVVVSIENRNV